MFKVGDRTATAKFYRDVLGMKFLRHEEFEKGCEAACNGPYDGRWSKSMVGYGAEDDHFVIELTYNYGIGTYAMGSDFKGITICSPEVAERVRKSGWPVSDVSGCQLVKSPDGHAFFIKARTMPGDPVKLVSLSCSNLEKSIDFWQNKLGMTLASQEEKRAVLGYGDDQCQLELIDINRAVTHEKAFGRIAFACPCEQLEPLQTAITESENTVLTPLVSLDTPGKATVQVVILADPDGHEICFVGDEAFRELSREDPNADSLWNQAVEDDKSNEWFAKKGLEKASA